MDDSSNLQPPELGPQFPIYPVLPDVVRITGPGVSAAGTVVYPALLQQYQPDLRLRDRVKVWVFEPNGVALFPAYYDCRLVGAYQGPGDNTPIPIYATTCCVAGPSSSSSSTSPPGPPVPLPATAAASSSSSSSSRKAS